MLKKVFCPAVILFTLIFSISVTAEDYYIDSVTGDDSNAGTSAEKPWASLDKINSTSFKPGDKILLKAGSEFEGQLKLTSSGDAKHPIVIDSYGKGDRPHIKGQGKVNPALQLYNCEYVQVNNLEVSNKGQSR